MAVVTYVNSTLPHLWERDPEFAKAIWDEVDRLLDGGELTDIEIAVRTGVSSKGVGRHRKRRQAHNVFRDGKVHVLSQECVTCIFNPHTRPVAGARVASMVRETMNTDGGSVVCHSTLYEPEGAPKENAVCRGWYDRLADRDPIFRLAQVMGVIEEVPPPPKL